MSIADIRREYARARLDETDVSHDPFVEFARWLAEAQDAQSEEPTAMTLASSEFVSSRRKRIEASVYFGECRSTSRRR